MSLTPEQRQRLDRLHRHYATLFAEQVEDWQSAGPAERRHIDAESMKDYAEFQKQTDEILGNSPPATKRRTNHE